MLVPDRDKFWAQDGAWHNVGTYTKDAKNLSGALDTSGLSAREYRLEPLVSQFGEIQDKYLVVMNDGTITDHVVSVVGSKYKIHKIREAFGFLDHIAGAGNAHWVNMGSIKNHRVVFANLEFDPFTIDPDGAADTVAKYGLAITSFDGSLPTEFRRVFLRGDCWNMLTAARKGASHTIKIRHSADLDKNLMDARKALEVTINYDKEFEKIAETLYQTPMTAKGFMEVVTTLNPKPEPKVNANGKVNNNGVTRWENKVDLLGDLFSGGGDEVKFTNENIRGTAWAAYNALTEYDQHYSSFRGDNKEENRQAYVGGMDNGAYSANGPILEVVYDWAKVNRKISIPV